MFEKEIIAISDRSLDKIKKLGAYFTIEQLNATDLHPAIIKYIDSELDYLIFLDRKELVQKSAFDYSNPEIVKYFRLISNEIKKNKKVSFEDAKNLIIQAVSFTANFLVRPKWSLTKFIYNEDQLKTIDEIRLSLNYLYYYDYLGKVLRTFIEKKRSLNFSLIDFEIALNKIDKELFTKQSQNLIDNALFSIADFFSLGGVESNKVSHSCIELFLKEKDLVDQLFRLRRALPANARQYYTINELRHIIHTPTRLDKSERLPSKTDEEKERKFETTIETKTEEPDPDVKNEEKEEITQEEMFDFEKETEEIGNNENENISETPEVEEQISDQQKQKYEEVKEEQNENSEEQEDIAEEIENETEVVDNADEVEEEAPVDDLDSLLEREKLDEFSSDEELLDAFDSQLKALEKETDMLSTEDEKYENDTDSEEQTNLKEARKIGLETEEENKVEGQNIEPEIPLDEDVSKAGDEQTVSDQPQEKAKKKEEKPGSSAPKRAKDLFSFLSNKEIEKIVINIFNEDREDFANTMEKITECFTYDEATDILKGVFFSYRINPYTRDAVTLTNAVSNYFNQAS